MEKPEWLRGVPGQGTSGRKTPSFGATMEEINAIRAEFDRLGVK